MVRNNWYKLDNVGKFYSFTNKNKIPAVFRYSVSLKEVIDEEILQNALNDILKYFSNFNCRLKKRIFWYYLENSNKIVEVKKEKYYNLYVLMILVKSFNIIGTFCSHTRNDYTCYLIIFT